ncbi:CU044_5270 family protein [Streptomyces sp. NBC_00669]|uniref:CU044_5270 family protein n=1 Tax=Streptomyces sp. NBC_00669 TaxID=2976011 RepID=UPI002E30C412|nr:CU044_5270 family protein [Streptomyces sp. NBC_00669]
MSTYDMEETGMTERQAVLDFPGAEALRAAGRVEPPPAKALAQALAAVEEAVREASVQAPREDALKGAVVRPFWKRRRAVALLAVAAVAAGVAVASANMAAGPAGTQQGPRAQSASAFLNDVAEVAATQSTGSGTYWKTHFKTGDTYTSRSMEFTYVVDGKAVRTSHDPGWRLGSRRFDWNALDRLTTDPALLLGQIEHTTKDSADEDEDAATLGFVQASTLLANAPASPELRSALFRALAQLKGVRVAGTVKDSAGRSGTELSFRGGVGTTEVIIDPRTSKLLELNEPWRSEKDQRQATYLSTGLTDTIG